MKDRELHCFESETDWVIAHDEEDAFAVLAEVCGPEYAKDAREQVSAGEWEWKRLAPDKKFKFNQYSDGHAGKEKTIAEWVKSEGRGFFASTEW